MPTPSSPPSPSPSFVAAAANPITLQSIVAALFIAPLFFLITKALEQTTYLIFIPFIFLALCFVIFYAVAVVGHLFQANRPVQIYVYPAVETGHNDQAKQEGSEIVLPPPIIYSKTQHEGEDEEAAEGKSCKGSGSWKQCAICMEDFVEGECSRVLPICDHIFHLICIDSWLKLQPSCPICRNSICKCTDCVVDVNLISE